MERRICADPALSALDSELAQAYRAALAASATPVSLRREQRRWLSSRQDTDGLTAAYRSRFAELKAVPAAMARMRLAVPVSGLRARCVPIQDELACKVAASGRLALPAGGAVLWQQQALQDAGTSLGQGIVLLKPSVDGRTAIPVAWRAEEGAWLSPPALVQSPAGPLLEVQGHYDGTGDFNAGMVFRVSDGSLVELDADSWTDALARRLPKDLQVWKGVYLDYRSFRAATSLWRPHDANCCPTGGRAQISFRLQGEVLAIDQVTVTRGAKAAAR